MDEAPTQIAVKQLTHAEDLPLPTYATEGSAGLDLIAAVPTDEPIVLKPGDRTLVPTGIAIALPRGLEAQIRPRSGLALKTGLTILNAPGTIDSDYRGEIGAIVINQGESDVTIKRGDRIAQMVIARYLQVKLSQVADLDDTARGTGGFGSTGLET